ncbi:hypothetical protein CYMTET_32430 [Cymbomonas tetramitiformis]|uniref:HAT C-terminal dimerisation domain-containing protein n=1 Tax=Cymbomonas tetramitiformis TaxID=36881 RepID=A0AAE0KRY7_9CHLO|nr:hypothetical protein CYMTET_32430 [Cymbomonas tetramitiformis]
MLNFHLLPTFLQQLEIEEVGDATTRKMRAIYDSDPIGLEVSFAAGYDGTLSLLKTTYELEGDRLEILLVFRRIEALRSFGRSLRGDVENRGLLPNVDAVIRRSLVPKVGSSLKQGHITSIDKEDPDEWTYVISYEDGDTETMVLAELLPLLRVSMDSLREAAVAGIEGAYLYLEKRLTGECDSSYDCSHAYLVCELAQLFDPSFVDANTVDAAWVQRLAAITPLARVEQGRNLLVALEGELPQYLTQAKGFTCDHSCVATFTEEVLTWWKTHTKELPSWSFAARIIFSLSPNSCACERVFSLLKNMFGDDQDSCLADYLQGSLMLRYNKRF